MPWVSIQNSWKGDVQTNTQSWMFIAAQFTPSVHSQMMDKCHMVPPHMEAFLSPEKGRSPNTCYHVDGPWEDDAQWEKQTEAYRVWFHWWETSRTGQSTDTESGFLVAKGWGRGWGDRDRVFDWGMVILKLVIINMYLVFVSVPVTELIKCWNFLSDKRYKGVFSYSQ